MYETTTIGEALRDLRDQRDRLDAAISALEALLGESAPAGMKPNETPKPRGSAGVLSDENRTAAVERLFVDNPTRVWTAPELAFANEEDGDNRELLKAYYNIVRRLANRGTITKLIRGKYRLTDTSTPVAAGVEVNEESTQEDSSREEGGNRDGSSVPLHDRGDALV